MDNSTEQLNQEWKQLRNDLKEKRIIFDEEYRKKHRNHNCNTKVYAWNGNWFCHHLTMARNREFQEEIKKIEKIISSMIYQTK